MAADRYGSGITCSTGKMMWATRKEAKAWMRERRHPKGLPRRIYRCPECRMIHMTSYTAEETRQIREKRAQGEL